MTDEEKARAIADLEVHQAVYADWNWRAKFHYVTYLGEIWHERLNADSRGMVGRGWGELAWVLYYQVGDYAEAASRVPEEIKRGDVALAAKPQ